MPEDALSKLLEVGVVDIRLGVTILVHVEPAAFMDGLEDAWELFLLLGQVYQETNDELVDFFCRDL